MEYSGRGWLGTRGDEKVTNEIRKHAGWEVREGGRVRLVSVEKILNIVVFNVVSCLLDDFFAFVTQNLVFVSLVLAAKVKLRESDNFLSFRLVENFQT